MCEIQSKKREKDEERDRKRLKMMKMKGAGVSHVGFLELNWHELQRFFHYFNVFMIERIALNCTGNFN